MKKIIFLISVSFIIFHQDILSQIPIYTWRDHLSYFTPLDIAFTNNGEVYVLTENGIVITDKDFSYINKKSKVNGLSDVKLSSIAYSKATDQIIIGYQNGNIDLIKNSTIINIPDIKLRQMYGIKTINKILPYDEFAYLACGFGIVKLDLDKKVILETYYIGENASYVNVKDLKIDGSYIYAATNKGIYKANINSNLLDYHNWNKISSHITETQDFNAIDIRYSKVFAISTKLESYNNKNLLFKINPGDGSYNTFDTTGYNKIYGFVKGSDTMGVMYDTVVVFFDSLLNTYPYWSYYGDNYNRGISATFMKYYDGYYWFNDDIWVFLIRANKPSHTYKRLSFATPWFNEAFDIDVYNDNMVVTKGGYKPSTENKWNTFTYYQRDSGGVSNHILWNYKDATAAKLDPNDPKHYFIGSWNNGLFEFKNDELVKRYDNTNSTLQGANNTSFIRIPDFAFDKDGNLWVLNFQNNNSMHVFTKDGQWKSITIGDYAREPEKILITQTGKIWILLARYQGIVVYDPGEDIMDISDDRAKKITIKDEVGNVLSMNPVSFAEDRDGIIWVGTTEGVLTFYDADGVFDDPDFHAERIILEIGEGIGQYLMKYETVTSIAVDGANRKWFGTASSGAYLMNPACTKEILHFTAENSPLPSNHINKITIDDENGEVYFSTDMGIVSFKNDATEAKPYFDHPYVYPNPVKPGYNGYITFTGLVQDADVKITDVAGNIVFQTKARGGTAVWDGKNFEGHKVKSGIYLALCTDESGKVTTVLKVLIIN
jgi:streptogramin lyase